MKIKSVHTEIFIFYSSKMLNVKNKHFKKIVGTNNFSSQFSKIISHYRKIGYNIIVLRKTACMVVNPIKVGNFAFPFNCTPEGSTLDSMMVPTLAIDEKVRA